MAVLNTWKSQIQDGGGGRDFPPIVSLDLTLAGKKGSMRMREHLFTPEAVWLIKKVTNIDTNLMK